jgi:hypothetical protein
MMNGKLAIDIEGIAGYGISDDGERVAVKCVDALGLELTITLALAAIPVLIDGLNAGKKSAEEKRGRVDNSTTVHFPKTWNVQNAHALPGNVLLIFDKAAPLQAVFALNSAAARDMGRGMVVTAQKTSGVQKPEPKRLILPNHLNGAP